MGSVWEDLAQQGWTFSAEPQDVGSTRTLERNGLRLSHDSHWSVQQYFASSTDGGWGDLQQIMSRIGLATSGNDRDLVEAAANVDAIKQYLDSRQWKADVRNARHEGMEKLREFERSAGMKLSWLSGEEDHLRRRTELKGKLTGFGGIKYWAAAAIAALYLVHKLVTTEDTFRFAVTIGAGFVVFFGGLLGLRLFKKI